MALCLVRDDEYKDFSLTTNEKRQPSFCMFEIKDVLEMMKDYFSFMMNQEKVEDFETLINQAKINKKAVRDNIEAIKKYSQYVVEDERDLYLSKISQIKYELNRAV